jgi:hypothetical protein
MNTNMAKNQTTTRKTIDSGNYKSVYLSYWNITFGLTQEYHMDAIEEKRSTVGKITKWKIFIGPVPISNGNA